MAERKLLTSDNDRAMARRMRDEQWRIADRVLALGTLWVCWWDKGHRHDEHKPEDLAVCGLIDGMELLEWLSSHPDWWIIGEWSAERYAAPVSLTETGRAALLERAKYDLEPVTGGLVQPGWVIMLSDPSLGEASDG